MTASEKQRSIFCPIISSANLCSGILNTFIDRKNGKSLSQLCARKSQNFQQDRIKVQSK